MNRRPIGSIHARTSAAQCAASGRCRHAVRPTGFALLVVLVVIALLALTAYTFSDLMITENQSAQLHGQQLQARALVDSGVSHVRYFLELDPLTRQELGGTYFNAQTFQAQLVMDHVSPARRGRFTIVAPEQDSLGYWGGWRFGLEDESGRLNLNALDLEITDMLGGAMPEESPPDVPGGDSGGAGDAGAPDAAADADPLDLMDSSGQALLMRLPGMTIDIADAILDWIDEDDEPREYGAEIDYYSSMFPPYAPRNGPFETVEELLLVRGVTPDLLFGRDVNRNGMIDMHEQELPLYLEADPGDGSMDRGWSAYLTLYSMEKNVDVDGQPRINLNGDDLQQLYDELSVVVDPSWATFIIAYRQSGPYSGDSDETEPVEGQVLDLTRQGDKKLTQVLDLIGVRVEAQLQDGEKVILESPFPEDPISMSSYLPELMDRCSIQSEKVIPGRVNINQAPRIVLEAIPGMTPDIVEAILSQRDPGNYQLDPELEHETWLLSRGLVTLDEMRALLPFITAGGDVYRAQVIGYFDQGEVSSRVEVVIDATQAYPRVLLWRDISHLGRGFARETLGIDLMSQ